MVTGYIGMCACVRDRDGLGGVSVRGDIWMCVCVCQRDRLGGVSGNGRQRDVCMCVRER